MKDGGTLSGRLGTAPVSGSNDSGVAPRAVGAVESARAGSGSPEPYARVDAGRLESALLALRECVLAAPLLLEARGVVRARARQRDMVSQIDDYLLPRLRQSGSPVLVALVGSTGSGKSTLVNSIVGAQVSATGIRRPTTNSPVLACHPADVGWFAENVFLPTLPRVRQQGLAMPGRDGLLVLASNEGMPKGVALLDTPDIDSVVQAHREFAHQFLDASDLWLFMTTARRYADAAVWDLLGHARERGVAMGIVLSRVPRAASGQLTTHFDAMLAANGLGETKRFVIPETVVTDDKLPASASEPVRDWLAEASRQDERRIAVLTQTMSGVLDDFKVRVTELAGQIDKQAKLYQQLRDVAAIGYSSALANFDAAVHDGSLLAGEALGRWEDFAGTGDLIRTLAQRRRGRPTRGRRRQSRRAAALKAALATSIETVVKSLADRAADEAVARWRAKRPGSVLLDSLIARRSEQSAGSEYLTEALADLGLSQATSPRDPLPDPVALATSSPGLSDRTSRAVGAWQEQLRHLVGGENVRRRSATRPVSFDEESLSLMLAMVALGSGSPGGDSEEQPSSTESAGHVPRRLLISLLGTGRVRELTTRARADLHAKVSLLLEEELRRFFEVLDSAGVPDPAAAIELYRAGYELEAVR